MKTLLSALFFFYLNNLIAQDLLGERIRKISDKKTSVYMDRGIFHNGGVKKANQLKAIRHSFSAKQGHERIVFDFQEGEAPRIYGHFSSAQKIISMDFFSTQILKGVDSFGASQFVEGLNFLSVSKDSLSIEIHTRPKVTMDIFSLASPGRLVIDLKSAE